MIARRVAALRELILACEAAALMDCENVVLHPGPERAGQPPHEEFLRRMHFAADALNRVAASCRELGVQLVLRTCCPTCCSATCGT